MPKSINSPLPAASNGKQASTRVSSKVKNQLLKEMYRLNLKEAQTQIVISLRQVLTKAPTAHDECIPWSTKEVI